jgi:PPK2 family polyphosphate:nucleotide phosphotransferase
MHKRLPDPLLDSCRADPAAPLAGDPTRTFGLHKDASAVRLAALKGYLDEQQQLLWANRQQAVLLWLQGPDCSGKDGVIRQLFRGLNPQGVQVSNFQLPSATERAEHFLARYHRRLPAPGSIGIFNRTPYEGVVADRQDGFIQARETAPRLKQIIEFEDQLQAEGIHLLKVYLQISPAEQFKRLRKRMLTPRKHWKLSPADLQGHRQFAQYQAEWANTLSASQRPEAPWYVLPADHKWLRNLLLASLLARQFETLQQQWPTPPLPFSLAQLQQAQAAQN